MSDQGKNDWGSNDPVVATYAAAAPKADDWGANDPVVGSIDDANDPFAKFAPPSQQAESDPFARFAMRAAPPATVQPSAPAPDLGFGETAVDAAKSLGVGVAQGALGLATLPGNLEQLARLGFDKTATALGYADPGYENNTILPNYNNVKAAVEKNLTGKFYEPKTTIGKYARTIGEFAPTALVGPGGMAARALNVVAPAVASETAGQLTKGTAAEPWARAAAGLAGGFVPTAAMRAVTPLSGDAARAAQVATLQHEGVDALTAGQQTGNRAVRWFESAANDMPFNGGRGVAMNDQAAEQFTRAALRRAGIQADRATPDVIDTGFTQLGNQFNTLAQRNTMRIDNRFMGDLRQSIDDYNDLTPPTLRPQILENLHDDLANMAQTAGTMPGDAYQALRSRLEAIRRGSVSTNPTFARTLGDIRDNLDDAMARSASRADQQAWQQARLQYRNLLAIEKAMSGAGENTALGLISPSQIRTAVKTQNPRTYVRGQNDLGNLARAGESIMKPLPNSGTPARLAAQHVMSGLGAVVGGATAHVPGAVVGAFLPALAQGALARTVMSPPVQRYLSNQGLAPALDWWNANRVGAAYRLPQAAADATAGIGGLRGGIGPRYDTAGNLKIGQE